MMKVSLCTIAYNEAKVLNGIFRDFSMQTYPHNHIEIILLDNMSTDNTYELMKEFKETDYGFLDVKVIQAPKKNQASAWNKVLEVATGEVIIRVDAHSSIPKYFVSRNILNIQEGENIVGGGRPNKIDGMSQWKLTLLAAEESLFGSSVADYRRAAVRKEYHSSLFHAAYKREVFETVGGFNEDLGRTEDNEIHYRMRKAGYKFCCCPEIVSYQLTRNTLGKMLKQKYGNGYWIGLTLGVCPKCLSYFHFIPFVFLITTLATLILWIFGHPAFFAMLIAMYIMFNVVNTVGCCFINKPSPLFVLLPFIFPVLHYTYGFGTLVGLIKLPFWKKKLGNYAQERIEEVRQELIKNSPNEKEKDTTLWE